MRYVYHTFIDIILSFSDSFLLWHSVFISLFIIYKKLLSSIKFYLLLKYELIITQACLRLSTIKSLFIHQSLKIIHQPLKVYSVISHWKLFINHWKLFINHWKLFINYWKLIIRHWVKIVLKQINTNYLKE